MEVMTASFPVFIYGLFNNAVSNLDQRDSNGKMISDNAVWKKTIFTI